MIETAQLITREQAVLQRQSDFFAGFEHKGYVGVLTNIRVDTVTTIYPQIIQGMNLLYGYMSEESLDLSREKGFLVRFLERQYMDGRLIPNTEVDELTEKVHSGDYSRQFDAYVRYRNRFSSKRQDGGERKKEGEAFGSYRDIRNGGDVIYNKRMYLSRVLGMRSNLQAVYGEVDYARALVAEMILNAPFLDTVILGDPVDDEARKRHGLYLEEVVEFAHDFKPDERYAEFEKATADFPTQWAQEVKPPEVSDFDRPFVEQVYGYADKLMRGDVDFDHLYPLYQQTIVRRGRLFQATAVQSPFGVFLYLNPTEQGAITFDDIAGYDEQKGFYQNLLAKTGAQDPIVGDIRIVIASGQPGLGKSLGVQAFLNSLPENARGMVVTMNNRGLSEFELLSRLAKIHPELEIFAVIEDIDAITGDRLLNSATRRFLEIDSVVTDSVPRNFHLLATTNRPDVIDPAVIRPGRTAKILTYEAPDQDDRKAIVVLHVGKNGIQLSDGILNMIATKSKGFTPDEVRHIVWTIRFEGIKDPTEEDIDRLVLEIQRKHEVEKKAKKKPRQNLSPSEDD